VSKNFEPNTADMLDKFLNDLVMLVHFVKKKKFFIHTLLIEVF
jgi:hypothetical protein